ncbi:hypothetical protein GOM71_14540 [Paenibacillus sp. NEAU-GSW1]|nr:hypothetical protein [Paenibacillus sp. NEAU-GSW1]
MLPVAPIEKWGIDRMRGVNQAMPRRGLLVGRLSIPNPSANSVSEQEECC